MSNTNAKQEFIDATENLEVLCASLSNDYWSNGTGTYWKLKVGYSAAEYEAFLNSLDFSYDSGYGGQELFGVIWYKDGTWSERGEYDGSEWWEHRQVPPVPDTLK